MAKPTGFLETRRKGASYRPIEERIARLQAGDAADPGRRPEGPGVALHGLRDSVLQQSE